MAYAHDALLSLWGYWFLHLWNKIAIQKAQKPVSAGRTTPHPPSFRLACHHARLKIVLTASTTIYISHCSTDRHVFLVDLKMHVEVVVGFSSFTLAIKRKN